MKPSIHGWESWITKSLFCFYKENNPNKSLVYIEMTPLLFHQVGWPTILDLESVGTGPSSRPILLPFRGNFFCFSSGVFEILESDLFQDNFSMALYSFGGVNDQCSVTSWAVQETGMLPLLSCDSDMTAWLKHK